MQLLGVLTQDVVGMGHLSCLRPQSQRQSLFFQHEVLGTQIHRKIPMQQDGNKFHRAVVCTLCEELLNCPRNLNGFALSDELQELESELWLMLRSEVCCTILKNMPEMKRLDSNYISYLLDECSMFGSVESFIDEHQTGQFHFGTLLVAAVSCVLQTQVNLYSVHNSQYCLERSIPSQNLFPGVPPLLINQDGDKWPTSFLMVYGNIRLKVKSCFRLLTYILPIRWTA